ncbi:MAG TPA: carboxypeptidase-like regulatory domain-containing protein [Bryobacteraceae bacterium]|jgi:hypothetical protein|nr:carboxypeptidase-like regulatory domain-containing protein [Bryobacteraceae bacterium]
MNRLAAALFACLVGTAILFAQTPTVVVTGSVVDPTGATVPEAEVTVTNQDTNVVSQKMTSSDGTFTIINLLPGQYALTARKSGFKKVVLPVFKLDVNQTLTQKITLEVGSTSDTVTVNADAVGVMIQRASTELGTTLDEKAVHELPLNGRNFTELLILQPGVDPVNTAQGGNIAHSQIPLFTGLRLTAQVTVQMRTTWTGSSTPTTAAGAGQFRRSRTPFKNSKFNRTTMTRNMAAWWDPL